MMKSINCTRIFLFSGLLACVAACSDVDTAMGVDSDRVAVVFTPQIEGSVSTRAVDTNWSEGDQVGICMVDNESALPFGSVFSSYQVSGSGASVGLTPTDTDQILFYPTNGDKVNFVAFSPYATVADNEVEYTAFSDQSTDKKMEDVDFLYHKGTTAYDKTSSSVALEFSHKLSKLVVKAVTVSTSDKVTLSNMSMTISGTPGSVTADLTDGSITQGSAADITPFHTDENEGATRVAKAIVVPHEGISGRTITFTTDEGNYSYTLSSSDDFEENKVYTLEFKVTRQGVTLDQASIIDWADDDVSWNNDYTLSISQTSVTIGATEKEHSVMFKTDFSGSVNVKYSTDAVNADAGIPDWISDTSVADEDNVYTCSFKAVGNVELPRYAYVHVTAGTLSKVIRVRQETSKYAVASNSYMLEPGAEVYIPVSRANEHTALVGETDAIGATDVLTAELLWMDTKGLLATLETVGMGADGAIRVKVASTAGNALIAVKVNNEIKWSWHIWVSDYTPTISNITVWMDRNLGATSATKSTDMAERVKTFGLYYQWGRKDPFPGAARDDAEEDKEPIIFTSLGDAIGTKYAIAGNRLETVEQTISWTVKNPETFIANGGSWMIGSTPNDRNWLSAEGGKTIYDPCPDGWRVPRNGSWGIDKETWASYNWESGFNGRDAVGFGGWYPGSGNRNESDGTLKTVGGGGFCWSANSVYSNAGLYLSFGVSAGNVNTGAANKKSLGHNVRCIRMS